MIDEDYVPRTMPNVGIIVASAEDAFAAQEKIERKGGIRLTEAMRESIYTKINDFKFKKSGEALDKQEMRLSHKAMVAAFGRVALEALTKIGPPYAFTAHDNDGDVLTGEALENWKGTKVAWRVGALGYQISMRVKDPLPAGNHAYNQKKHFTVKAGPLADEIVAWQEACTEWLKDKRTMESKVRAVLNSVTTFNSLQRTWPDGERFWKHIPIDFPFRNQVPAVKVDELNDALGI